MEKKNTSRRDFLATAGKAGIAAGLSFTVLPSLANEFGSNTKLVEPNLDQKPLPYGYKDLEPAIDALTMEIHYTKHAAGYTKNLKDAIKDEYKKASAATLTDLLADISKYSTKMRNNAGGHYNHELFWQCMSPKSTGKPSGKLAEVIDKNFGSFDAFKTQFSDAAKTRFGSGWAWLIITADKKLKITSTPNQDNPLMDIAEIKGTPLLGLDIWEHAYYLKYQNKRPDYINSWFSIVNWDFVQQRFESTF